MATPKGDCIECAYSTDDICFICDQYVCEDCDGIHRELDHFDEDDNEY